MGKREVGWLFKSDWYIVVLFKSHTMCLRYVLWMMMMFEDDEVC